MSVDRPSFCSPDFRWKLIEKTGSIYEGYYLSITAANTPCFHQLWCPRPLGEGTGTAGIKIWVGLAQLINFIGKEKKYLFCLGTLHIRRHWNLPWRVSLHYVTVIITHETAFPVSQFTPTADFILHSCQRSDLKRPGAQTVVLKWFLFSTCVLNKFRQGWTQVTWMDVCVHTHGLYAPPCQNEHIMPCFKNNMPYFSRGKHFSSAKSPQNVWRVNKFTSKENVTGPVRCLVSMDTCSSRLMIQVWSLEPT